MKYLRSIIIAGLASLVIVPAAQARELTAERAASVVENVDPAALLAAYDDPRAGTAESLNVRVIEGPTFVKRTTFHVYAEVTVGDFERRDVSLNVVRRPKSGKIVVRTIHFEPGVGLTSRILR